MPKHRKKRGGQTEKEVEEPQKLHDIDIYDYKRMRNDDELLAIDKIREE